MSEQVREYARTASADDAETLNVTIDLICAGDPELWSRLPMSESWDDPRRAVVLMPNGHVLVWQPYGDYPDLLALFYAGAP